MTLWAWAESGPRHSTDALLAGTVADQLKSLLEAADLSAPNGSSARLETVALIDRNVNKHRSRAHPAHHIARDQLGAGGSRHQEPPRGYL